MIARRLGTTFVPFQQMFRVQSPCSWHSWDEVTLAAIDLIAQNADFFQFLLTSNLEEAAEVSRVFDFQQGLNELSSRIG